MLSVWGRLFFNFRVLIAVLLKGTAGLLISCTLGRHLDVVITKSNFKSGTIFDSSAQTTWGMLLDFFFVKPENGLV